MKIIDLEAHFMTRELSDYADTKRNTPSLITSHSSLFDLGEGRVKAMDSAGIDVQVLSCALTQPRLQEFEPDEAVTWAKKVNDQLAEAVEKYPERLLGLASIPPQSPAAAAQEIERAVQELGMKGVCINSHARDEYLDDRKYWPIFEAAANLDVPIYLHPTTPSKLLLKAFKPYNETLNKAVLGFAFEVSLHALRLIYSGLFDQFPDLKIVLGHMGEGLPFWLYRIDFQFLKKGQLKPNIAHPPSRYVKNNFFVTTSGMFFQPALLCAMMALGADKIGFAVDYPFEKNEEAVAFINQSPISDGDKKKIFYSNAQRLFNF